MNAPRLILVLDRAGDNAQILRIGAELARSLRAEVALLAIVDPRCAVAVEGGLPVDTLLDQLRADAGRILDQAEATLGPSLSISKLLREGEPGPQICQSAAEWLASYLVVGANSYGDPSAGVPGATDTVVRSANCPVIVVPPTPEPVPEPDSSPSTAEPPNPSAGLPATSDAGLTQKQAEILLRSHGANEVATPARSGLATFLMGFWGPAPWTLEAALLAILALGKWRQAVIIAVFLVCNAAIGAFYEGRASAAVRSLRKRLVVQARVKRDGIWTTRPAREVVPGDVARLRSGDVVPADLWLLEGAVLLDYSTLTGEALPVEVGAGAAAHAGTVVRRGEATGQVTATGDRTVFATTATLDHDSRAPGRFHAMMLRLVRLLALVALAAAMLVALAAPLTGVPWADAISFGVALLLVAMPVSLPIMVTLTGAVGARELAAHGILLTRLSAIQDSAAMDIVFVDKTGTLTSNNISVERVTCAPGASESDVLLGAAAASTAATLDPLDVAILRAVAEAGIETSSAMQEGFLPFDPTRRMSEGTLSLGGRSLRGVKGTPDAVAERVGEAGGASAELLAHVDRLGSTGGQVLAVAIAEPPEAPLRMAGLVLFADPPRADAAAMIAGLRAMGVRVVMVTGDGLATASSVAAAVGVGQRGRSAESQAGTAAPAMLDCDIHAGVQPADKLSLIRGMQNIGHVVGMIGDGVNDARALRQADMGIAVASATDVARAAAGVVLSEPGLAEVVEAVRIGRTIQQRIVTFLLSMIASKAMIVGFLGAVLLATANPASVLSGITEHVGTVAAHPGLRPALILLLVLFNVVLTLPLAADRAKPSAAPDHWSNRSLGTEALTVAALWTALLVPIYLVASRWLGLSESQRDTLAFLLLAMAGQAVVFNVRTRGWLWSSRPSEWVLGVSALGIAAAAGLAITETMMVRLPVGIVLAVIPVILACMVLVDLGKRILLNKQGEAAASGN